MSKTPLSRRTLLTLLPISFLMNGCGAGSSSLQSQTGSARFVILWPKPSRLIPTAAQSITIRLTGLSTITKTVDRPATGTNETTVSFPNLDVGSYTAIATAHPNAGGTGTAQATGTVNVTITANQTTTASLTMGTTIANIEVSPTSFTVPTTGIGTLTATARDTSNAVVLTGSTWSWSSSDTSKATVAGTTTSASVTGLALGSSIITATETESGKSGNSEVSIGFKQGEGLAASSWPRAGANQWNTFHTPVSGTNSGKEKWSVDIPGGLFGNLVIDENGDIYAASTNKIYKISPQGNLSLFFTANTNDTFYSALAIAKNGDLYYGTNNILFCISPSGSEQWSKEIIRSKNHASTTYRFHNINTDKNNNIIVSISYYDPVAFSGISPTLFYLTSLGTLIWTQSSGSGTEIAISNNHIATSDQVNGGVYWLDFNGATIKALGGNNIAIHSSSGDYYCGAAFSRFSPGLNQVWESTNTCINTLGLSKDKIIIEGHTCISAAGNVLWKISIYESALSYYGKMAISSTKLYIFYTGGIINKSGLYSFNLSDGSMNWFVEVPVSLFNVYQPILGPDETLYLPLNGSTGKIKAYK